MPVCGSCGDSGAGVYCSACGERRERREPREFHARPSASGMGGVDAMMRIREAFFATQREMEARDGVDDTPQTPTNFAFRNASEMRWCNLRTIMQARMVFDEEWIVDTPRSELLWQATCLQKGIQRGQAAAAKTAYSNDGPVGFTWWGSPLPQTVEIVDLGDEHRGLSRVKVSVTLGRVAPEHVGDVLASLSSYDLNAPLSAFLLEPDGMLKLVCALAMDTSMIDEVSVFLLGMMARQVAWGLVLRHLLTSVGHLETIPQPHPTLGEREDTDELVSILFEGSPWDPVERPGMTGLSPEGFPLPDLFSPVIAHHIANVSGAEHEVVTFSDLPDTHAYSQFSPDGSRVGLFMAQPAGSLTEGVSGLLRPDPGVIFWYQRLDVPYASEDEARRAANDLLCSMWADSSRNIVGSFHVASDADRGVVLRGPMSRWSGTMLAAFGKGSPTQLAEAVWHVSLHLLDQADALIGPALEAFGAPD